MTDEARLVTANRLRDGVPVYFGSGGTWSRSIADAVVVGDADGESLLAAAAAGPAPLPVVAPYLIAAELVVGPDRFRAACASAFAPSAPPSERAEASPCTGMTPIDRRFLEERVAQYRDQVARRLAGQLSEDEFKPLRLMNGLYLQLHAYMLRIAIPYGTLSSRQLRTLAHVSRRYDRGFGHFTTRQNVQFHWIKLEETPEILAELAAVEMHAIQTSGNSFRNTTTDPFAGAAADEVEDPRPYCEIIRQWSTLHPEFSFLPRKFKIAVSGAVAADRAAVRIHDIGLYLRRDAPRRGRIRGAGRRRPRPHADHRPEPVRVRAEARSPLLSRGDSARLQPGRTARQSLQVAHQDPGAEPGHRAHARGGRGGMGGDGPRRARRSTTRHWPKWRSFSRRP